MKLHPKESTLRLKSNSQLTRLNPKSKSINNHNGIYSTFHSVDSKNINTHGSTLIKIRRNHC